MNMTAEERAKALVALLKSDFGQSGDDVWFYAIRDELKAHSTAALEAAAKVAEIWDSLPGSAEPGIEAGGHIATAIRALREEGLP